MKKKFYLATAIAYASDIPHFGNVYEVVLADSLARFWRLYNYDVYFQTGTDEHGQKILQKALSKNQNPQNYVNAISKKIKKIYDSLYVSYDNFIRTSDPYHKKTVQDIISKLCDNHDIYLGKYEGFYSVIDEAYVFEKDLINGLTSSGERPKWISEEVYFFRLSKYQQRLCDYLKNNDYIIQPSNKRQEILNLLKEPLPDLAITRTLFKYGIYFPSDPKHCIYVWVDALINYLTGVGYQVNLSQDMSFFNYWPCNIHIIGKDIMRFHLIYFLILLMALKLPLSQQFFIHPFILFNNKKMSKSKGNVLYIDDLLKVFSVDTIRYFMLHEIPYNQDGNITYDLIIERHNADLVNNLGNLVNRVIGMLKKYRQGYLKKVILEEIFLIDLKSNALNALSIIKNNMLSFKIADALEVIMRLVRLSNKYIDVTEPWNLLKQPNKSDLLDHVLYSLTETLRFIGVLLQPFLPSTSTFILKKIGSEINTFESLKIFGLLQSQRIFSGEILFQRLDQK